MPERRRLVFGVAGVIAACGTVLMVVLVTGNEVRANRARDAASIADRIEMHKEIARARSDRDRIFRRLEALEKGR